MILREIGFVDEVKAGYVTVKVAKKSACGENCASCSGGCAPGERTLKALNTAGAKSGDKVVLELEDTKVFFAAFAVYILPIAVFLAGYFWAGIFFEQEWVKALAGVLAAVLIFFPLRRFDRKNKEKYMARIVKKL